MASSPPVTQTPAPRNGSNGGNGRNGRAERRAVIRRRRIVAGAVAVGLLVVVVAGVVVAVGGGGDDSAGNGGPTTTAEKNVDAVSLPVGTLKVEKPGFPADFPADVQTQVMALYTRYVDDGIVTALRTGKAKDADLPTLVDAGVTAKLAGPDRAVLFDEDLPPAVGKVTVTSSQPVPLTALAEFDGKAVIVIAGVQLDIVANNKSGPVHIVRSGDLLFAPDLTGAWKITGFDLSVDRSGKGVPGATTTTVAPAGGTTATTKAKAK